MMKAVRPVLALILLSAAGCATTPVARDGALSATAEIHDAGGRTVARARLTQSGPSIRVQVEAAGLAAGTYGTHIHTTGLCEAPGFTTAGSHWNPTAHQHGTDNPQGPHLGDMPNLVVDASGRGSVDFSIPVGSLTGGPTPLLDADGAAIVIHAQADDYRTDPSGNSGARIACGVVARG
jgi:Cu-Zn family superoxide dismutase